MNQRTPDPHQSNRRRINQPLRDLESFLEEKSGNPLRILSLSREELKLSSFETKGYPWFVL